MPKHKVAVTLERRLLDELDALVAADEYPSRSQAIEAALAEALARRARTRLAAECAKLDPDEERALAEEGLGAELSTWPEYGEARSVGRTSISHADTGMRASVPS